MGEAIKRGRELGAAQQEKLYRFPAEDAQLRGISGEGCSGSVVWAPQRQGDRSPRVKKKSLTVESVKVYNTSSVKKMRRRGVAQFG